jgi:hypothetical protein
MSFDESPSDQVSMRLRISRSTLDVVTKYEKEHDLKTSSHTKAINQIIIEYEKLQKEITIAHTLDDVLRALPLLEASITEQIKQAQRPSREARYYSALCLALLNDMQFESKNKYHYDADSPRLTDAKKQLDSTLSKARSYKQESAERKNWSSSE